MRGSLITVSLLLAASLLSGCGGSVSHSTGVPTITSFTASSSSIVYGKTTDLTAQFSNGIGVVTPGSYALTSGSAVTVEPLTTTTYTLTVSNSNSSVTSSMAVTVVPASAPAAPLSLKGTASDGLVTLSWTPGKDTSFFYVYRRLATSSTYKCIGEVTAHAFEDNALTNGSTYVYMVRAEYASGDQVILSADSNTVTLTPKAASSSIDEVEIPSDSTDSASQSNL